MANIFKDKYGDGHKVQIKDKTGLNKIKNGLGALVGQTKYGITPGTTKFSLVKVKTKQKNPKQRIFFSDSGLSMFMMKLPNGPLYEFIGSKSAIQNAFSHAGDGKGASDKSATNDKTELKELISMCILQEKLENNKDVDFDFVEECMPKRLKKYFHEDYFTSAQKQVKVWLSKETGRFKGKGYIYERQLDDVTKNIYKNALDFSGLSKDNWNPGDVWIVKKNMDFSNYTEATNVQQINKQLVKDYKDEKIVGISLKQINPNQRARIDYVNLSATKKKEVKFNFKFSNCDFTGDTFKNAIIYTESGFGVRMGFKASTENFGVYLEGRFKGAGSQVGGMDAKQIPVEIKRRYGYEIRKGGTPDLKVEEKLALKEMKEIFQRHKASDISNTLTSYKNFLDVYDKAPKFQKQRLCRIVSFMYPYMELSFDKGGDKEFKDLMNWSYTLAKKETDVGGFYVFLGP